MPIKIMLDMAPGIFVLISGINLPVLLVTFVMIIVLEGWLLWKLKWADIKKALYTAILINIVSALIGLFFGFFFMISFYPDQLFTLKSHIVLFISWIITLFVEGVILVLLNRRKRDLGIYSSFVINIASYLFLDVVLFGLSRISY